MRPLEVTPCGNPRTAAFARNITPSEKSSDNDKYGTGSLVTREGSAALERRRRRLHELVRADGPGERAGRKRPPFGADAVSQELDPGALRRTRSDLLAGRDAGSAPDRPHRAHRDALRARPPRKRPPSSMPAAPSGPTAGPAPELRATAIAPVSASHDALGGSPLDPRLTFGSFVIGRSNTLAHAAARQVAEGRRGDSVMFNPLYIHAGVGLGKTHLLQAVTWAGNSGSRAQGAVPHRGKIHVRLRRGAEDADGAGLQGSAARHRRAGDRRPAVPAGQVDPGRILSHPERADRCRPPGGDRGGSSAVRPREPRRPRALASRRRPGGRDGLARRGTAARHPQVARRRGARASCELRRAGAGAGLSGAHHHP